MIKKEIKFKDLNGEERTEDFYFDLSASEIMGMEFSTPGGFKAHIERIIKTMDRSELYRLFKEIVLGAYGEKTPDGKYFIKKSPTGQPLGDLFEQSPAFDVLFLDLMQNEESMSEFTNGIVPSNLDELATNNRQSVAPIS